MAIWKSSRSLRNLPWNRVENDTKGWSGDIYSRRGESGEQTISNYGRRIHQTVECFSRGKTTSIPLHSCQLCRWLVRHSSFWTKHDTEHSQAYMHHSQLAEHYRQGWKYHISVLWKKLKWCLRHKRQTIWLPASGQPNLSDRRGRRHHNHLLQRDDYNWGIRVFIATKTAAARDRRGDSILNLAPKIS